METCCEAEERVLNLTGDNELSTGGVKGFLPVKFTERLGAGV